LKCTSWEDILLVTDALLEPRILTQPDVQALA
jgi:hypothetical protein